MSQNSHFSSQRTRRTTGFRFGLTGAASLLALSCAASSAAPLEAAQPEPPPSSDPASSAHHGHHHGKPGFDMDFSDVEHFAKRFDGPERDASQKPEEVLDVIGVTAGHTVADLGAGTGYFLPYLSKRVGPSGRVFALDVEPNMVEFMRRRASEAGLTNVEARVVATDSPGLAESSVDRILIVNTWHHIHDRVVYGETLKRALRPQGLVAIVDFTKESKVGPPPSHRLSEAEVTRELAAAGFTTRVAEETLPDQYIVIATP